jgi:predicted glycoside hydrolase/deacetylase ChbG (UPF0249 family)
MKRSLIVNADDFGQSFGVNRGVMAAHERGIVTSASLMVRWPAAADAAAYSRRHPALSVGLHLDLGEWTYRAGTWIPLYEVVPIADGDGVAQETTAQLDSFRRLLGRDPTHIDSHQHVHLREPVRSVVVRMADQMRVPLRGCTPGVRHCGEFYGQMADGSPYPEGISVTRLIRLLAGIEFGFTELGCHPGEGNDLQTMYCQERSQEVQALCHPRVREALSNEDIMLCSFHALSERAVKTLEPEASGPCRPIARVELEA